MWTTERLRLIPASLELLCAERDDRERFARLLDADVPGNWPPESQADALEFFVDLLTNNPSWEPWLAWYALEGDAGGQSTLVGGVGFKGAPDERGRVEIGYSVLPQFQQRGIATEMARGVIAWATSTGQVSQVLAQTTDDNTGSLGVLRRLGFGERGPGEEPGHTMYALDVGSGGGL